MAAGIVESQLDVLGGGAVVRHGQIMSAERSCGIHFFSCMLTGAHSTDASRSAPPNGRAGLRPSQRGPVLTGGDAERRFELAVHVGLIGQTEAACHICQRRLRVVPDVLRDLL